ncbi:MAG: carboxypeptidase-like regulatory domain-containing protein, partial [Chitinophagaceae bacterium]|nr:carboxypeptidase-like regulatory domain-containing protein [Chitinophagaceae bacterium]
MRNFICLLFVFVLITLQGRAQRADSVRVSGEYININLVSFVNEIEKQTGLHFFYNIKEIDSVNVSISASKEPVPAALEKALNNTGINYAIYDNYVFLSKGHKIQASLNNGRLADSPKSTVNISAKRENSQVASLENKLYTIGAASPANKSGKAVVAGYVRDDKTGEPVAGASIQIEKLKMGVVTDEYGYYSITVPTGRHVFSIQSMGMSDTKRNIVVNGDGAMDFELSGQVSTLRNVIVSAQKLSNVKGPQMGVQKIDMKTIKQVPVVFGEADVLRVITTLPGVKTVGEASTGLNVRGGSADQNLILFNDATIYNPSHFFGMFSAFNPDVVKDVTLYKSSIPARYGGRLSSVLDIGSREGNKKEI